jgi:3-isopropylmalate dehydrogenase
VKIALLPGDGIGPEVIAAAVRVIETVADAELETFLIGGAAIDATGSALPEDTLRGVMSCDAALLGAVGGPKWSDPSAKVRPEDGLLALRKAMGVFANIRPVKVLDALVDRSPLREERVRGVDFVVVRELTGGLYFGERGTRMTDGVESAFDTLVYSEAEVERVIRVAMSIAGRRKRHVTSVDKANVLESSRLWRRVADRIVRPPLGLSHQLVDSCAMLLLTHAHTFDVIVTENMFGDILTDEAAAIAGSIGVLPSASIGEGTRGLYEPIHGSAPDIAGRGVANPIGAILSAAMMLRLSFDRSREADAIERAVEAAITRGARTRDLGGTTTTEGMTDAVVTLL